MTKYQYELLENFGQHRIEDQLISVSELRLACLAAVSIIPFKSVIGLEYMADPDSPTGTADDAIHTRTEPEKGPKA